MEKWIIALLVLSNLYFAWRWFMSNFFVESFMFYIIKKGYTPPTKEEWRECISKCAQEKSRNSFFYKFRHNK